MSSSGSPRLRGVLFDAGNTLIRVRGSVGELYAAVARRHGLAVDGAGLDALFRRCYWNRRSEFVGYVSNPHSPEKERAWWRALVREVFETAGLFPAEGGPFEVFFDALYAEFARGENWEVFEDVIPCLEALDRLRVPVGIVSNWDSRLHPTLEGVGLRERFRFVITSAEFGAEKPDASIFLEGARRLGVPAAEVLYVGDLVREDLEGSRAAGLQGVLVERTPAGGLVLPSIRGLREIPALLMSAPRLPGP